MTEQQQQHDWTFAGELVSIAPKTTKGGKDFCEIVARKTDGKYTRLCVCTHWRPLGPEISAGSEVRLSGRIDGREYNGRCYAGLTALDVEALDGAGAEQETELAPGPERAEPHRSEPPHTEPASGRVADDPGLPF